jgi:hypothetical protein
MNQQSAVTASALAPDPTPSTRSFANFVEGGPEEAWKAREYLEMERRVGSEDNNFSTTLTEPEQEFNELEDRKPATLPRFV